MSQSRLSLFLNAFIFHPNPIIAHIRFPANTKFKVKVTHGMLIACLVIAVLSLTDIRCFTNVNMT